MIEKPDAAPAGVRGKLLARGGVTSQSTAPKATTATRRSTGGGQRGRRVDHLLVALARIDEADQADLTPDRERPFRGSWIDRQGNHHAARAFISWGQCSRELDLPAAVADHPAGGGDHVPVAVRAPAMVVSAVGRLRQIVQGDGQRVAAGERLDPLGGRRRLRTPQTIAEVQVQPARFAAWARSRSRQIAHPVTSAISPA